GGNGTLDGTVTGNELNGHWHFGVSNGTIKFVLSGNNKTFSGNWDDTNQWCGARTGEKFANGCAFAGSWNTTYEGGFECDMKLDQIGTQITGKYCNGSRTITGNVTFPAGSFMVLNGTWKTGEPSQGPLVFYLKAFTASQFQ